jgi:transposase
MDKEVTLTGKEQKRLYVLNEVEAGRLTNLQAANMLGISERQVYRLKARYRVEGAQALAHGNRGRASPRRIPTAVREQVVELIHSYSPQARGRVERLFGTLQDRLVKELGLENVCSLDEANRFLTDFLTRFNAGFAEPPAEPESAYLPLPDDLDLEAIFCLRHRRKVRDDNTISFSGQTLQIPADRHRGTYARCQVEVRRNMDGCLSIVYQSRELVTLDPEAKGPTRIGKFTPAVKAT